MLKNKKTKFTAFFILALLSACSSLPLNSNGFRNDVVQKENLNTFIEGIVEFPQVNKFETKTTITQLRTSATVSLIYPSDHPSTPNETIATGLSNSSGFFFINPDAGFIPVNDQIYLLEASKRIGNSGDALMSVRTYLKWTASGWTSISTPGIRIDKNTTALTIINDFEASVSASDLIQSVVNKVLSPIGSVTVETINQVAGMVDFLLTSDVDPARFIVRQNGDYLIDRETSLQKLHLIANKECRNCDLRFEQLNSLDLTGADLTNTNLSDVNFTGTNLSNGNLTNTNLSGVTFSGGNLSGASINGATTGTANFSGATWTNGSVICEPGSIGYCVFPGLLVNTYTTNHQTAPIVEMDADGDFVVTWQSYIQDGSSYGIYAQRYNLTGGATGSEFRVNTYTTGIQRYPNVAMDGDGDFVITWEAKYQDGDLYGVYAQRYSSDGSPVGSEFKVNTYTTNSQRNPVVAMDFSGNFVIAWRSYGQDGSGEGVYAKRYNSNGTAAGSEFRVNTYTTSTQSMPEIAIDSSGNFVIVWDSRSQDGNFEGIFAKRYASDGSVIGSEFKVNTYTTDLQAASSVAMDADGDFVITWHSNLQDGANTGIYAQRYNSNGTSAGSEFRVNTYTTAGQAHPEVAMDADGDFIITWMSNGPDGSGYGVYAQRYNSDGSANGSEFLVNTYTTNLQGNPSVSMDDQGDFVFVWKSNLQDGSGYGVYRRRFNSVGQNF